MTEREQLAEWCLEQAVCDRRLLAHYQVNKGRFADYAENAASIERSATRFERIAHLLTEQQTP